MNKEKDKKECFARINKEICNALSEKECENCNFYKCKDDVLDYEEILKQGKKELLNKNRDEHIECFSSN